MARAYASFWLHYKYVVGSCAPFQQAHNIECDKQIQLDG